MTHLRIRLLRWEEFPPTAENDYPAEAIRGGDGFYYRARGVTLPITEYEFRTVTTNPFMYYFSTALKLHLRIERARAAQLTSYTDLPKRLRHCELLSPHKLELMRAAADYIEVLKGLTAEKGARAAPVD